MLHIVSNQHKLSDGFFQQRFMGIGRVFVRGGKDDLYCEGTPLRRPFRSKMVAFPPRVEDNRT